MQIRRFLIYLLILIHVPNGTNASQNATNSSVDDRRRSYEGFESEEEDPVSRIRFADVSYCRGVRINKSVPYDIGSILILREMIFQVHFVLLAIVPMMVTVIHRTVNLQSYRALFENVEVENNRKRKSSIDSNLREKRAKLDDSDDEFSNEISSEICVTRDKSPQPELKSKREIVGKILLTESPDEFSMIDQLCDLIGDFDVNLIFEIFEFVQRDMSALHISVKRGFPNVSRFLCEACPRLGLTKDFQSRTPLHFAAAADMSDILEIILDRCGKFADLNAVDTNGQTPLCLAIYLESNRSAELLMERGADFGIIHADDLAYTNAGSTLHAAASVNNLIGAQMILAHGIRVDSTDTLGNTPLMQAIKSDSFQTAKFLIEAGASFETRNKYSQNPMKLANQSTAEIFRLIKENASAGNRKRSATTNNDENVHQQKMVKLYDPNEIVC